MCNHCIEKQIEGMIIKGVKEEEIISILAETRQDISIVTLQDLLSKGFDKVIWHTSSSDYAQYDACSQMDNREWTLADFISETQFEACVFSHSHVNCLCEIEVINSQNGETVKVNYNGVVL